MEDQKRDRSDDDLCNKLNLVFNGSENEILNNMSGDLASDNNNNTNSFNLNTDMHSELVLGPVLEQIIQSLNGLSPCPNSPPNLGLMTMQNIPVVHKEFMNATPYRNQCEIETDPMTALQRQADQLMNFGNDNYVEGRYSLALSSYSEAIKLCPRNGSYYSNRSNCSMIMGDYEAALKDSKMIIAIDSTSEDGYICIIKCYLALGNIDDTKAAIDKLIQIGSDNNLCRRYAKRCERLRSLLVMATKCFETQDFQATVQYVDTALEIAPACLKCKLLKARCLVHLGRIHDANAIATSCEKSKSSNSNASSVDTKYMAGIIACTKGDLDEGLTFFQKSAELDLDQIKARIVELKTKKADVKKHDKSDSVHVEKVYEPYEIPAFDDEITEAFDIEPPGDSFNVELYINRAFMNAKKGHFSNTITDCTYALNISPNLLKALLLRAKCHNEMGNYEHCFRDYEAAFEIERTSEIELALKKAKIAWKNSAVDKADAGNDQFKIKNYFSALQLYNEAIHLCSSNSSYYCYRSKCLIKMGDYNGAIRDGKNAVSLDKNSKEGFECILKCSLVLGDLEGLEEASNRLIEIDPNNEICKQYNEKCKQLWTLIDMATQCFVKKDFQATVGHVNSALKIATACLKLKLMKAECLVFIERVDDGISIAVSCLEIDPLNVNAFYVVGLCSYYKGDLNDGLTFFQKALDLDSNHDKSKIMLSKAKDLKHQLEKGEKTFEAGEYRVAQRIFTEALEIDSLNININSLLYSNRAKCHNKVRDLKKCVEDYKAALKLKKSGEIEQALKEANIALKRQAKFKKNTGDKLFRSKKYSAALSLYNKAIELSPEYAFYFIGRSECLIMIGDYKSALKDGQEAVALDENSKKGYECITECCLMLGNIDSAETAIKSLIEMDPNNKNWQQYQEQCKRFRSIVNMAMQCYEKDDFRNSVYHANSALGISPACVKVKMLKAENLIHLGRVNEADDIVSALLKTDPSNADVFYVAGLSSYYKCDLDQGLKYFEQALGVEPGHNKAHSMQIKAKNLNEKKESGDNLFKAGKFHDAHKMYTEALQIDSLNSDFNAKLYFNRALMESKMGNHENAIADCAHALDLSPRYLKALLLRGKCHNDINDFKKGIKDYESALKISNTTEIRNSLKEAKAALKRQADSMKDAGNQQFRSGNYSSALNLYNEAIKLWPNDAVYYRNKSTCLIKMRNYTEALKEGRTAVALDGKSEKGYECIIKSYLTIGDIAGAETHIKKLVDIGANQKIYKPYEEQLNELRTSVEKATQTFEKKDFKAAVQHIESVLKIASASMKYKLMKAECLINVGRFDEANDIAVLCMLINAMNTDAVYISGLCSYYKGDLASGLTYFQKALVLDPDHIKARIMRFKAKKLKEKKEEGDVLFRIGRYREAYDIYTESLKIDSSNVSFNAKLHFNRALMTSKMSSNWKNAIGDTTAALKMAPNYVKAYLLRAKCHNEMENYEECVNDYEAAQKIEKSSETERLLNEVATKLKNLADNKKNTGDEQYNAGRYSMALCLYNQAIKLSPKYAGYYIDKSKCLFAMLKYTDALKESQQAVKLDCKSEDAHDYIMKCSLILGDVLIAKRTMRKLIGFDSNNLIYKWHQTKYRKLKASVEMATQSFEKKNFQTAVEHIDDALEIATACTQLKLLKVECFIYLGRYDEAKNIITLSRILGADAVYLCGLSSYYKGDLYLGLNDFEQALKIDPNHKKAQTMRLNTKILIEKKDKGDQLFKAGKFNEAQKMYTEALKVNEMSTNYKAKLLFNRALMDSKLGNFLNSIDDCTDALDLSPKYLKVILLRAKCYSEMENYRDCINDYETALKIEGTSEIERALEKAKNALEKQSEQKDYYKILKIAQNASDDEIKKAYYKQAKLHHPDKHAGASRETNYRQEMKFKIINEANTVLSDPVKRRQFDYSLRKSSF